MMKVNYSSHYNENYFYPNYKEWKDEFGVTRKYFGPAREWHGFMYISEFIRNNFGGVKTLLDIGCGAGSFVAHSLRSGFDTVGVDISRYAVTNPVEGAEGKIRVCNVVNENIGGKKYDMITAFDFAEHIYKTDWPRVHNFIRGSLKPKGYVFLCIATAQNESELWTHSGPEDEIPTDKNWLAVAGHVYVRYMENWIKEFRENDLNPDFERMIRFALWKVRHHEMKTAESWGVKNVLILRNQ